MMEALRFGIVACQGYFPSFLDRLSNKYVTSDHVLMMM